MLSWQQILWDRISSLTTELGGYPDGIKGLEAEPCEALLPRHALGKALAPSQAQPYHYAAIGGGRREISAVNIVSGGLGCCK